MDFLLFLFLFIFFRRFGPCLVMPSRVSVRGMRVLWTIFFSIVRLLAPYGFLFFIFFVFIYIFQALWAVFGSA
jgi:hypothetical protein